MPRHTKGYGGLRDKLCYGFIPFIIVVGGVENDGILDGYAWIGQVLTYGA